MALTIPILPNMASFDATLDNVFTFSVPAGGDQVTKNRLTIINQSTGAIVYQTTRTTFAYTHTLTANTLTNGTYYSAYINTFNSAGTMSANSNTIQFYCYTTPSYLFTNLPSGNTITNSSFTFEVTYEQAQGELLNSYQFFLYDAQHVQIATSNVKYVSSTNAPPTVVSYNFGGFADLSSYFIKATGQTVGGTIIETPLIQINIQYVQSNVFAIVQLSQNCTGGYVTLTSNMIDNKGTSNPSPPIYIENQAVDLTAPGSYVNWNNGQFDFSGDFTLSLWGRNFTPNQPIITMQNALGETISIRYMQGYYQGGATLQTYCDCTVKSGSIVYYIYSEYINNPLVTENIQVWLRRINNIYQINIYNLG